MKPEINTLCTSDDSTAVLTPETLHTWAGESSEVGLLHGLNIHFQK